MPHNYIFGQELCHHFVENRAEDKFNGHTNSHNTIGMKRKESWLYPEAGNFEIQQERVGPTYQKRIRFSPGGQEEVVAMSNGNETAAACIETESPPPPICHSMVAHMALSYRNENLQVPSQPENVNNDLIDDARSCDVEMECEAPVENASVSQQVTHHTQDNWHGWSCDNTVNSTGNWWENIVGSFHGS